MSLVEYIPFYNIPSNTKTPSVICLGNFDGVHIGHAELIRETVLMKESFDQARSAALCFSVLPANYFQKGKVKSIMSLEQKLDIFKSLGLDGAYVCDFGALGSYSPERFIKEILFEECNCVGAVCGFNYSFGAKAVGTPETLKKIMLDNSRLFKMVDTVELLNKTVSSSAIREYIQAGDFISANLMLGRPFCISHEIIHGANIGTKLGYPTINHIFSPEDDQIIPAFGIYATKALINDRSYIGVTNIGVRPTVSDSGVITCETHLINPVDSCDLYGNIAKVQFFKKLRNEQKFNSLNDLSAAIAKDIENAKKFFCNQEG